MRRIGTIAAVALMGVGGWTANQALASIYSNAVLADNPQIYWQIDESSGAATAVDSAPISGANNGSYRSGTAASNTAGGVTLGVPGAPIASDPTNTGASLNGDRDVLGNAISTTNYLTASAATVGSLSSSYTVEFWFNNQRIDASAGTINGYIFDRGATFSTSDLIGIDGTYPIAGLVPNDLFLWNGSDANVTTTHFDPTEGTWYLLDLVRSGSTVTLYINGVAQHLFVGGVDQGTSATLTPTFATSDLLFGKRVDDTWSYQGDLDEAAIFGSALSSDQVLAHYDASLVAPEPASLGLLVIGVAAVLGRRRRA